MNFYSEFGEDKWIWDHVPLSVKGQYVDIGCSHPERANNTAFLRKLDWRGLALDANPAYQAEWDKVTAEGQCVFEAVILASQPTVLFKMEENSQASRICMEGVERPALRIEEVLNSYGIRKIDLLSIDIEGAEFDVLSTLNLELHAPTIIISEYNTQGMGKDYRVFEHLLATGYHAVHQTVANIIYVRSGK